MKLILLFALFAICFSFSSVLISEDKKKTTLDYWTKQTLSQAVPIENLSNFDEFISFGAAEEKPVEEKLRADTEFVRPESLYSETPYKTMGKLYFKFTGFHFLFKFRKTCIL